jgi:hypothetical protein
MIHFKFFSTASQLILLHHGKQELTFIHVIFHSITIGIFNKKIQHLKVLHQEH